MKPMVLNKLLSFTEKNFNLIRRYLLWEIVFLCYTVVNVLAIGYIGKDAGDAERILFLMTGSLLWGFLSVLFHEISAAIAWERWEGTLEYTFMAPINRSIYIVGQSIFAVVYGVTRTAISLFIVVMFFDLSLKGANLASALLVLVASSVSFIGLGIIASILPLLSPEKGEGATHIFQAALLLVSGIYYSIDVLPGWMQALSVVSPATYTLRAMRAAILRGAGLKVIGPDVVLLLVSGLVLVPVGFAIFSVAERYAKRTGKLSRSG